MRTIKTVLDDYDDPVSVSAAGYQEGRVFLQIHDKETAEATDGAFTPARARRLARALLKAADVAEAKAARRG